MQGSGVRSLVVGLTAFIATQAAWAAVDCSRPVGSLPNPNYPPGTADPLNPIEHVIVIMQENHSFDNYFGKLNAPEYYGSEIDGIDDSYWNPRTDGTEAHAFHQTNYCSPDPEHSWDTAWSDWNNGKMDQFVINNSGNGQDGDRVMGYYDGGDLNYYYALANEFAVADRYFCSVPGPTLPNRYYLMTGTSFGHTENDFPYWPKPPKPWKQKTIFDVLQQYGISWKYYFADWPYLSLFDTFWKNGREHTAPTLRFQYDLKHGGLPAVSFVESSILGSDEHPPNNIQTGQKGVAARVKELMDSPYWKSSVLFLTYDENGGYYDHVEPPEACAPGDMKPTNGGGGHDFDRLGFRVPFIAVSPYVKHHYVSHNTYDHTSILRYIENKWNIPALSLRDANADGMEDLFDYSQPKWERPNLPKPQLDRKKALKCMLRRKS